MCVARCSKPNTPPFFPPYLPTSAQLFAWDASGEGVDLHMQANPSQAELLKKQFKEKTAKAQFSKKKSVLDKYGGAEYLDGGDGLGGAGDLHDGESSTTKTSGETVAERNARFGVSVEAKEYTRDGRLVKGGNQVSAQLALKLRVLNCSCTAPRVSF